MTEVDDDAFDKIKEDNARLEQEEEAIRKAERDAIPRVTSKDIAFVIETICKEAKYDKPSVLQLFYGMATAFTKFGMGHKVNSKDSGAGKSYLTNKVADYYPEIYLLILGGASNKAFQHKQGEMVVKDEETGELKPVDPIIDALKEEKEKAVKDKNRKKIKEIEEKYTDLMKRQKKLINLDNTIIVIQDTPQEALAANLMSLISQDGEENEEYMFVDDKLHGTSNIIHGMPVIFYTRMLDDTRHARAEEIFRRFVNVTPNTTKEKVQEANRVTFKRYGLLPEEYGIQVVSSEEKTKAKEIVAKLVEKLINHTKYLQPKRLWR